jgi:hypothetical protein
MLSIQCPNCGLSNKATHSNCVRCYSPLPASAVRQHATAPGRDPLVLKLIAGGVLLVLLVMAAILTFDLGARRSLANRNAAFESAIRNSTEFKVPVTTEVGRYTFYNRDSSRLDQEATPGAYTLDRLGLLHIHTGLYSDISPTVNSQGKQIINPETGLVPFQYSHIDLELTQSGQAQSATWQEYEVKNDGKVGWKVPIGERELLQVVQVMPQPGGQPLADAAMVSFTWKWKPNEVGQAFDKRVASYVAPDKPKNFPRSSFELYVDDSQALYWGTADIHKVNGVWEASRVIWVGTQGVKISPNDSEEIDRIIKASQAAR